jgi:acyl carrier protein
MTTDLEAVARERLAQLVDGVSPDGLDPAADMAEEYGLTSLNKVLFLTSVCDDTGVGLANFTEQDLARMRTLGDVVAALARHAPQVTR